jgi:hypothetical protein
VWNYGERGLCCAVMFPGKLSTRPRGWELLLYLITLHYYLSIDARLEHDIRPTALIIFLVLLRRYQIRSDEYCLRLLPPYFYL